MQEQKQVNELWNNNLRTVAFFAIYQCIFNKSIGLEYHIKDYQGFLESISTEYPELFVNKNEWLKQDEFEKSLELEITKDDMESNISKLAEKLQTQLEIFYTEHELMTVEVQKHLSDWNKTFGIVKAILYCFLLEKKWTNNNSDFVLKAVGKYIKLAEEFTILANIKLIHAILSKIQS
jgi:transcription termination factor NusB